MQIMKRTTSNAVLFADGEIGRHIFIIMKHQLYYNYILGKNF